MTVASGAALALSLAARMVAATGQEAPLPTPQTNPAEFTKVAEAAIERVCASCHGWDVIGANRYTTAEWDEILKSMAAQGARATASEMTLIRGYVLWSYGRVAVNAASAEELAPVLGIPAEVAKAIVAHRAEHGPFKTVDDLATVPGLARKILDGQAGALQFEVREQGGR